MRFVHVITPGDHYSPRTGSAIATVVHGLCSHGGLEPRPAVAVARGTYVDRYVSAVALEYDPARHVRLPLGLSSGQVDAALSRVRLPRMIARHYLAPTVQDQANWAPSVIFGHNAPQLVSLIDRRRHAALLYAHNAVLKTYTRREVGRSLAAVSGIICVSNFLADETSQHLPAQLQGRIRVVHSGVDVNLFRRTEPIRASETLRVVFVGRMIPDKGADVLLMALAKLRRADIHVTLVGSRGFSASEPVTDYERHVRRLAAGLGETHVSLKPFMPPAQVAAVLRTADVVAVPSTWPEPFALTVREGMASGAAVVASDVGGIPEALAGNGLLVPPGDADALASALEALADDDQLLRALSTIGRRFAVAHDWSHAAADLSRAVAELTG